MNITVKPIRPEKPSEKWVSHLPDNRYGFKYEFDYNVSGVGSVTLLVCCVSYFNTSTFTCEISGYPYGEQFLSKVITPSDFAFEGPVFRKEFDFESDYSEYGIVIAPYNYLVVPPLSIVPHTRARNDRFTREENSKLEILTAEKSPISFKLFNRYRDIMKIGLELYK